MALVAKSYGLLVKARADVVALTTIRAGELARYGTRVGAVAPGFIETDMIASMREDMLETLTAGVPLKRLGGAPVVAGSFSTRRRRPSRPASLAG